MLLTQQTIIIAAASQDAFVGFFVSLHLSYKKWLFFVLSSAYLVVFIQNVAITVVTSMARPGRSFAMMSREVL